MASTFIRNLGLVAMAAALSALGLPPAADAVQLPPGITLPPRPSDTTTTTTAAPPQPASTVPPTLAPAPTDASPPAAPPTLAPAPGDGAPGAPGAPATGQPPPSSAPGTTTAPGPQGAKSPEPAPPAASTTTLTTKPGEPPAARGRPVPSLSAGQVDDLLRNQQRSGANSTQSLVDALRPLQNVGMTLEEALALGMGQFPLLGVANWTDDWLDPRSGPPPHPHMGNDLFAAFDTPVRAPVAGIVRFEDAGLGGKGAFVTAPDGTYYYMAHLNAFSAELVSGSRVEQGQIVGYNGDSGNAKGGAPHVHFEIHPGGGPAVNPKPIVDGWVADAMEKVPALIASYLPTAADGTPGAGVPDILVATGMTRRFAGPSQQQLTAPGLEPDFRRAVLRPLTPSALARLLDPPTG